MSRNILPTGLIRSVAIVPVLASVLCASDKKACDNESIKGVYGYTLTGWSPVPNAPGQLEQLIGVGVRTHDGQGNFTQIHSEKRASTAAMIDVPLTGTYSVNSDCTGTMTTASGIQSRYVIVNKGKEIRWITISSPVLTVSGHAIRQ